ncbi:hypothetical protein J6590_007681 [Homalodisca vitripennis]|nr:hypothetical protein J6590_007681 [Homalodisca vitripennis]
MTYCTSMSLGDLARQMLSVTQGEPRSYRTESEFAVSVVAGVTYRSVYTRTMDFVVIEQLEGKLSLTLLYPLWFHHVTQGEPRSYRTESEFAVSVVAGVTYRPVYTRTMDFVVIEQLEGKLSLTLLYP